MNLVKIAGLILVAGAVASYIINGVLGSNIPAREMLVAGIGLLGGYYGGLVYGRYLESLGKEVSQLELETRRLAFLVESLEKAVKNNQKKG